MENAKKELGQSALTLVVSRAQDLGFEAAKYFLQQNEPVCYAHQDIEQGESDRLVLLQTNARSMLEYEFLDLSDLESVQRFAHQCYRRGHPIGQLVIALESNPQAFPRKTKEGLEYHFATFLVGPFFLAIKLAPLLVHGAKLYLVSPFGGSDSQCLDQLRFLKSDYSPQEAKKVASYSLRLFLKEFQSVCHESGLQIQLFDAKPSNISNLQESPLLKDKQEAPPWLMEFVLRFGSERHNQWIDYDRVGKSYGQRKTSTRDTISN